MKQAKRWLAVLLAVVMIVCAVPVADLAGVELFLKVEALDTTGSCGDNVVWHFDDNSGLLTISGVGPMKNYSGDYVSTMSPFRYQCSIKTIIIGNGVTSIGSFAFYDCLSLTSVTIPESVTSIGGAAFRGCSDLNDIKIPDNVTKIGAGAFSGCMHLNSVTIPNGVETIYFETFKGSGLTSITIPDGVTTICESAFYKCQLNSIIIPKSLKVIGDNAFFGCSRLTRVEITDIAAWNDIDFKNSDSNPLKYAHNLYLNGTLLTELIFPDSVKSIGSAFSNCSSLISVTIPNSVISITDGAFYGCSSLTSVTIPDGVTSIGHGLFWGCSSLTNVTLPDSVTSIGGSAFYNCRRLISITIPNSVLSISHYAFYGCSKLTAITIPDSVTYIGNSAFRECSSLKDVYYEGTRAQWQSISIGTDNDLLLENVKCIDDPNDPTNPDDLIFFPSGTNYFTYVGETALTPVGKETRWSPQVTFIPGDSGYGADDVTWTSSNPALLQIKGQSSSANHDGTKYILNCSIRALATGNVTLTASLPNGYSKSINIEIRGSEYYVVVTSPSSTNSVPVNETMTFEVRQYKNGETYKTTQPYVVSFSESGLFEVVTGTLSGSVYALTLKAKKQGSCIMTINDPSTGAVFTTVLTATEAMNVFRFNTVPLVEYQKGRMTNFYNVDGLCIDSFDYRKKDASNYQVSFYAYNANPCCGVAVAYDKDGKIHDVASIDAKKEVPESFVDTLVDGAYQVYDLVRFLSDRYYYTGEGTTKRTYVSIEVPQDGYLTITCSPKNEACFFVNLTSLWVGATFAVTDLVADYSANGFSIDYDKAVDLTVKEILKEAGSDMFVDIIKNIVSGFPNEYTLSHMKGDLDKLLQAFSSRSIDYAGIIKQSVIDSAIVMPEGALFNLIPTGRLINELYSISKTSNLLNMASFVSYKWRNPVRLMIYPPLNNEDAYVSNGIKVTQSGALDENYVLHTYALAEDQSVVQNAKSALDSISSKREVYNITLYKNGVESQPNGTISVHIPIPANFKKENAVVYWLKDDGSLQVMDTRIENGYAVFTTNHLSNYVLFEKEQYGTPEPQPNLCPWCGRVHEGFFQGIIAFFHRIFARLFGTRY